MGTPPPIELASLGMADSLILMVLALVVFGPRRLPQIGRQIGKLMFEFRKASNDFKFQMEEELRLSEEADRRKKEEEERKRAAALVASTQASVSAPAPTTIEAQADVAAVESSTTSPNPEKEGHAGQQTTEGAGSSPNGATETPTIQAPSTGEQVSASRPDYAYPIPDAAGPGANGTTGAEAASSSAQPEPGQESISDQTDTEAPASRKEPVSQHG